MIDYFHKELSSGKWNKLSLPEQMANIGVEVNRTIIFHKKKDIERFKKAFIRALELFDLTLDDDRWRGREKEIARSREVFCGVFFAPEMEDESDFINKYFLQFGVFVRLKK